MADIIQNETAVRTIYGSYLNVCKALSKPFKLLPNSTLNQKFGLFANEVPGLNETPSIRYLAIGNRGETYDAMSDGFILTTPIKHTPTHAALYNHIPFVVRPIADDISPSERLKFRMRVPFVLNGITYVAYYLRVIDIDSIDVSLEYRSITDSFIATSEFVTTISSLSPTPPTVSSTDLNNPNGDYIIASAKTVTVLNAQDISNILEACTILYNDPRYAVINELAICSGVDRVLQGNFGNITSNYTEAIGVQCTAFLSQSHTLSVGTTEVKLSVNIGSGEALTAGA